MCAAHSLSDARILVVEDEAIIARDLMQRLEDLGYQVAGSAATGAEALALAESTRPSLVFMDITIQGPMDGIETARHLSRRLDVPIIFVTAHTDTGTFRRARLARPYGYLIKPIGERELVTAVEMALSRHENDVPARLIEQAIASAGIGVLMARAEGADASILSCNPAFEKMTGYSAAEILGRSPWLLQGEATDKTATDRLRQALGEGRGCQTAYLAYRRNGTAFPCTIALSRVSNAAGETTHFLFCITDVSGHEAPS